MYYADVTLSAGASLPVDPDHNERAIYTVSGDIEIAGDTFTPSHLLVLKPGDRITVRGKTNARFMILGRRANGPRYIWWNFVSSRKDRIEQAKTDWKMARFDSAPEDPEFIPLPANGAPSWYPRSIAIKPLLVARRIRDDAPRYLVAEFCTHAQTI
jgi:hypothetical protein